MLSYPATLFQYDIKMMRKFFFLPVNAVLWILGSFGVDNDDVFCKNLSGVWYMELFSMVVVGLTPERMMKKITSMKEQFQGD